MVLRFPLVQVNVGITEAPLWAAGYPRDDPNDDDSVQGQAQALPPEATSLQVYYRTGASMAGDPIGTGTLLKDDSSLTWDQVVGTGVTVYYQMRGVSAQSMGPWSVEKSAIAASRVPGAPATVTATRDSSTQATISWTAGTPDNADTWRIERNLRDPGGPWEGWASLPGGTTTEPDHDFIDTSVPDSKEAKWRVRGENDGGGSAWTESNVLCMADAPGTPSWSPGHPVEIDEASIDADWTAASGVVDSYEIRYRVQGEAWPGAPQLTGLASTQTNVTGLQDNTTYELQVRAVNACQDGAWSVTGTATTDRLPITAAPVWDTGYPKDDPNDDASILGSWGVVQEADTYQVYYRVGATFADPNDPTVDGTELQDGAGTSFDHAVATGDTVYYAVRGRNPDSDGPWSVVASATAVSRVPGAPATVTATRDSATQATISWTAGSPDNADTWEAERRERDPGGAWGAYGTFVGNTTTEPDRDLVDSGLFSSKEYQWRVRGSNDGGDGAWTESNVLCMAGAPGTPSWEAGHPVKDAGSPTSAIDADWAAASGEVSSYEIRYREQGGSWPGTPQLTGLAGTQHTVTGLADNTTYELQVRAVNACQDGAWSVTGTATTDQAPPATPTGVAASPVQATDDQVSVSWNLVGDATGYDVDRAPDSGGAPGTWANIVTDTAGSPYTDTGRAADTKYWYRVRSRNAGGTSASSAAVSGTTHVETPQNLSAVQDTSYCPGSIVMDVSCDHLNGAGDARSEAFDTRYYDGTWNAGPQQTAGTTAFEMTVNTNTTKIAVKYAGETTWAETSFPTPECPT